LTRPRAAAIACAAVLASACATPQSVLSPVRVDGEEGRVQAWVDAFRIEGRTRTGLRALGSMKVESPSGSGRVREVILVERPAQLRLESLDMLGQTRALLVTDGASYAFYDGGKLERGPVLPELLRDAVGLDLEPHEAVRVLLADPGLATGPPVRVYALGADRLAVFPGQRVLFAPQGDVRSVEILDEHGNLRWAAEYRRWRDLDGGRYPFAMTLRFPRSNVRAEIELDEVDLNPVLAPALFVLPPLRTD